MYSGFDRWKRCSAAWPGLSLALVVALVLALSGCDSKWNPQPPSPLNQAMRPMPQTRLGPIPGPAAVEAVPVTPPGPPGQHPLQRVEGNPLAGDRQAMWLGRTLFLRFNCYGCHGGHGGGSIGPSLRGTQAPADEMFDTIVQGRPSGMPAWGTMLTRQEIWALVAYIQSLGTSDEPESPS